MFCFCSRVSRALHLPRGNIVAIGNGGCGRKTIIKLATCMAGAQFIEIFATNNYQFTDWRNDVKRALHSAGVDEKFTVFLFSETQAKVDQYMDDAILLLNNYEIPNLYSSEEKTKIVEAMHSVAKEKVHTLPKIERSKLSSLLV